MDQMDLLSHTNYKKKREETKSILETQNDDKQKKNHHTDIKLYTFIKI